MREAAILISSILLKIVIGLNFSEKELHQDLFDKVDKYIRPESNFERPIHVFLDFVLEEINSLNVKDQSLDVNAFSTLKWFDPQLIWNASDYGGIDDVRMDPKKIWTPGVTLFNSAAPKPLTETQIYTTYVIVESNGSVTWISPTNWISSCSCDISWFPFDSQTCNIRFGSWSYDNRQLILKKGLRMVLDSDITQNYQGVSNGEWKLTNISVFEENQTFRCCRNPYSTVRIQVKTSRLSLYYVLYTILPQVALILAFLVIFHLDLGQRSSYGVTLLLSISVYLLVLKDELPPKSDDLPFIGITFIIEFFLLCVGLPVAEFCGHTSQKKEGRPPAWLMRCVVSCEKVYMSYSLIKYPQKTSKVQEVNAENVEMEEIADNATHSSSSSSSDVNAKIIENMNYEKQWLKCGRFLDYVFTLIFFMLIILVPLIVAACI